MQVKFQQVPIRSLFGLSLAGRIQRGESPGRKVLVQGILNYETA